MDDADLVLQPEADVRARLGAAVARLHVLAPAVPSLGVGKLRVLRLRAAGDDDARYDVVAGYDRYEPLNGKRRAP